jgi:hypothetical protein
MFFPIISGATTSTSRIKNSFVILFPGTIYD